MARSRAVNSQAGFYLLPPLDFQFGEQRSLAEGAGGSCPPQGWEGSNPCVLCWRGHPCQVFLLGRSGSFVARGSFRLPGAELKASARGIHPASLPCCRRDGKEPRTRPRAVVGKIQYRDIQK